jgi:hypothetical protein
MPPLVFEWRDFARRPGLFLAYLWQIATAVAVVLVIMALSALIRHRSIDCRDLGESELGAISS